MARLRPIARFLLLCAALLAGCSGGGAQGAAGTARLLRQLPSLSALPAAMLKRQAAATQQELLSSPPLADSGGTTVFYAPGSLQLAPPDMSTMAYAIFGIAGLPTDGSVFPGALSITADSSYYLAVSDYSKSRWRFIDYSAGGSYPLSGGAGLISPAGGFYVAVIGWQSGAGFSSISVSLEGGGGPHELWYYLQTNLQVDANRDAEIARLDAAAAAGYTKVLYADSKLDYIDTAWSHYIDNLKAFNAAAEAKGIDVIPAMCAVGYAGAMLMHDPNLIEGQPVKDCEFDVSGGEANVAQDPATVIANGGFENHTGDTFPGWNQMDGAGVSTFADAGRLGGTSIRFSNYSGNDRISQQLTVQPWHCYVVHFWLKTQGVRSVEAKILNFDAGTAVLTYNSFPIGQNQDWTQYHLIFNSQDKSQVYLYLGIWGGTSGSFWIDDVSIENAGLCNLIRRPGAPFSVKSWDGATTYSEGSDYDPVSDPGMGYVAGYGGTYDLWHTPPAITIPAGSRIHNGDKLKVSYYHAVFTDQDKCAMALAEDATFTIVHDLLQAVHDAIDPPMVMIAVDEHRVGGWSEPGFSAGTTTGELLAQFTQHAEQIAKEIDPGWRLIVWSDMYDPWHNMQPEYYLCHGGTLGASDGLSADWDVANWHSWDTNPDGSCASALNWFSGRGNRQILSGYYDEGANISIGGWLDKAKGVPGVYAVMYTTWGSDYTQLANFAQAVRDWEAANP